MKKIHEIKNINIAIYAEPDKASGLFKFAVNSYDDININIKTIEIKQIDENKPNLFRKVYTMAFKGYLISATDNPNEKPNLITLFINFFGEEIQDNGNICLDVESVCEYKALPSEAKNFFNKQLLEIQKSFEREKCVNIDNECLPIIYGVSKCYKPRLDQVFCYGVFSESQE